MKRVVAALAIGALLGTYYTSGWACKQSTRETATAKAAQDALSTAVKSLPVIAVTVDVPTEHLNVRSVNECVFKVTATEKKQTAAATVTRTARVAATLGRALFTTVGAVVGELVDAAMAATSTIV